MGGQTIRMELSYDGSRFAGFARQPGQRTVEGLLRERMAALVPDLRRFAVGGRTDKGVHACGQVVSFHTLRKVDLDAIREAVAPPGDIELAIGSLKRIDGRFQAQYSARGRHYAYFWPGDLDLLAPARELLLPLVGRTDLYAFARHTPAEQSTVKRIDRIEVRPAHLDDQLTLRFDLHARGFLRQQVRVLVATTLREARSGAPAGRLADLALQRDRRLTANPAPAEHLYLVRIHY